MEMTLAHEPSAVTQVVSEIGRILLVLNVLGVLIATVYVVAVQRLRHRVRLAIPALVVRVFLGVHACIALLMLATVYLFFTYEDPLTAFASVASLCLAVVGLILWRRILVREVLVHRTPGSLGLSSEEHGGV